MYDRIARILRVSQESGFLQMIFATQELPAPSFQAELCRGFWIALLNGAEEPRDFVHVVKDSRPGDERQSLVVPTRETQGSGEDYVTLNSERL